MSLSERASIPARILGCFDSVLHTQSSAFSSIYVYVLCVCTALGLPHSYTVAHVFRLELERNESLACAIRNTGIGASVRHNRAVSTALGTRPLRLIGPLCLMAGKTRPVCFCLQKPLRPAWWRNRVSRAVQHTRSE